MPPDVGPGTVAPLQRWDPGAPRWPTALSHLCCKILTSSLLKCIKYVENLSLRGSEVAVHIMYESCRQTKLLFPWSSLAVK